MTEQQIDDFRASPDFGKAMSELVERLVFANVYPIRLNATRLLAEDADEFHVRIEPKYMVRDDRIDYLFEAACIAFGENEVHVARIECAHVATFDMASSKAPPADAAVQVFGSDVALLAAYPYLRETVQSLGTRLGLPNLTMDLIRRGAPLPDGLSIGPLDEDATPAS